jgi:hypothetical protein
MEGYRIHFVYGHNSIAPQGQPSFSAYLLSDESSPRMRSFVDHSEEQIASKITAFTQTEWRVDFMETLVAL